MKNVALLILLALVGCSPLPSSEQVCVDGILYWRQDGVLVQVDGSMWTPGQPSPVKCRAIDRAASMKTGAP